MIRSPMFCGRRSQCGVLYVADAGFCIGVDTPSKSGGKKSERWNKTEAVLHSVV